MKRNRVQCPALSDVATSTCLLTYVVPLFCVVAHADTHADVRHGWDDPLSERSMEEHIKSVEKFLMVAKLETPLVISEFEVDGDQIMIVFSFSFGLLKGQLLDSQSIQVYTITNDGANGTCACAALS